MTETAAPPLLPHDECDKLEQRVQHAVAGFVEAPRASVEEADRLLEEIAARFTDAVTERRKSLRQSWQASEERHREMPAPTNGTTPAHGGTDARTGTSASTGTATPAAHTDDASHGVRPGDERPRSERDLHGETGSEKGRRVTPAAPDETLTPTHRETPAHEDASGYDDTAAEEGRARGETAAGEDTFTRQDTPEAAATGTSGAHDEATAADHAADTEQLRLALRDYRELAERLLHV